MIVVVACTATDSGDVIARVGVERCVSATELISPGRLPSGNEGGDGSRRLLLATVDDEAQGWRLAAVLRSEGFASVARPAGGPRLQAWVEHTRPVVFDDRLSVCFAWSEHDRSRLSNVVELGPGGFGNGEHPTTRLLIEQLMRRIGGGERVLDVGCGSGVLGLCALRLGAAHVVATDRKAEAVEATLRNASLNGMADRVAATVAPLSDIAGAFDIVVANIARSALVELAPQLVRLVAPSGWLGASGISPEQCSLVTGFMHPLAEVERQSSGDWSALVLARSATR